MQDFHSLSGLQLVEQGTAQGTVIVLILSDSFLQCANIWQVKLYVLC